MGVLQAHAKSSAPGLPITSFEFTISPVPLVEADQLAPSELSALKSHKTIEDPPPLGFPAELPEGHIPDLSYYTESTVFPEASFNTISSPPLDSPPDVHS